MDQKSLPALMLKFDSCMKLNLKTEAQENLEKLEKFHPNNDLVQLGKAISYIKIGRIEEGLHTLEVLTQFFPNNNDTRTRLCKYECFWGSILVLIL